MTSHLLPWHLTEKARAALAAEAVNPARLHRGDIVPEPLTDEQLAAIRTRADRWRQHATMSTIEAGQQFLMLVAEVERLREHSITLNTVGWKIAQALGDVPAGAERIEANATELTDRMIAELAESRAGSAAAERERIAKLVRDACPHEDETDGGNEYAVCSGCWWYSDLILGIADPVQADADEAAAAPAEPAPDGLLTVAEPTETCCHWDQCAKPIDPRSHILCTEHHESLICNRPAQDGAA